MRESEPREKRIVNNVANYRGSFAQNVVSSLRKIICQGQTDILEVFNVAWAAVGVSCLGRC